MKYSIINYLMIVLFGSIILTSCFKDKIDINLNEANKKVVITAWITDLDELQFVKLTYTTNYLDNNVLDPITEAEVKIMNDNTTNILEETAPGVYNLTGEWSLDLDQDHILEVKIGEEIYTAKAKMYICPELENIYIEETEVEGEIQRGLYFSFQDNIGEGDGYFARDYTKGSLRKDSLSNGDFVKDELLDGFYFEDISLSNESFNVGDTAVVELFSIGIDAVEYLEDIEAEIFRGGLFDPPPVNIRSNFSNGALGYFIIGGAQRETIIVE